MKDIEIVVFNDKSWVRFTEYQKLDEELKQEKQSLAKRIYELQSDLSKTKSQIEKMKPYCACEYCKHCDNELTNPETGKTICDICNNNNFWELAE